VSYYWKAALDRASFGGSNMDAISAYPSNTMILYERNSWHSGGRGLNNGAAINCLFEDGHAELVHISNSKHRSGERSTSPVTAGEPAWFNYNTKTRSRDIGQHWDLAIWCDSLR
jgi:hypothetical protein